MVSSIDQIQEEIIEMLKSGNYTFRQIADHFGISLRDVADIY